MYFRLLILFFTLSQTSSFSLASDPFNQDACLNQLKELLDKNPNHPALKKVLNLQGKLTLQRLAWSLANKGQGSDKFTVEKAIDSILNKIDDKTKTDVKFKEAYDIYSGHKLNPQNKSSRNGLLAILPHIQEILNTQVNVTDPNERKKYIIQKSDITLLSILAEKETRNEEGLFDHILKSDRTSDRSILNFTKIINSSLRNKEINKELINKMMSQIPLIESNLRKTINNLPLDRPCLNFLSGEASCLEIKKQEDIPLIAFIRDFDQFDKTEQLKYGDIWLTTTKAKKFIVRPRVNKIEVVKPKYKELEKAQEISTKEIPIVYLNALADNVLNKYPYFLSREELISDPELLMAINHSLEQRLEYFVYQGNKDKLQKFTLPNGHNKLNKETIKKQAKKLKGNIEILVPNNITSKEDKEDFISHLKVFRLIDFKQISFEFKGRIYDTKTGKLLPPTKEGLLSYPDSTKAMKSSPFQNFLKTPHKQKQIAYKAAKEKKASFIYENKLYFIGSTPVDINKEIKIQLGLDPLEHEEKIYRTLVDQNLDPSGNHRLLIHQALLERQNALKVESKIINPRQLTAFSPEYQTDILNLFIKTNPKSSKKIKSMNKQQKQDLFLAIKNNQPIYQSKGKVYHTFSNDLINKKANSSQPNEIYWNNKNKTVQNLNSLSDKETIMGYHKHFSKTNQCEHYSIVNKAKNSLSVYSNSGELLFQTEVLTGQVVGDQRLKFFDYQKKITNSNTSAGIFKSYEFRDDKSHNYYSKYGNCLLALENEDGTGFRDRKTLNNRYESYMALHQTPRSLKYRENFYNNGNPADNRATNGCINLNNLSCVEFKERFPEPNCPFYILPEEKRSDGSPKFEMKIKEDKLVFTPTDPTFCSLNVNNCTKDYAVSPTPKSKSRKIKIKISNPQHANNKIVQEFLRTLEDKKEELSQKLEISNDEYNNLTKLAYAILGVESGFGAEYRYAVKEGRNRLSTNFSEDILLGKLGRKINTSPLGRLNQWMGQKMVDVAKAFDDNDSENSRGLTQIKNVTAYTKLIYPEINENNLTDPRNAAIATMVVLKNLSDQMQENEGNHHNIKAENRLEFLYYLYNGANSQVTNGAGAIALSIRAREIKENLDEVHIYEEN